MTGQDLTLHTRLGVPVPLIGATVRVVDGKVELAATLSGDAWATIENGLLMNLDTALDAGGQLPPMLPTGEPVALVARLQDELAADLLDGDAAGAVLTAEEGSPLRDTQAWFVAEAQAGGEGYVTGFAAAGAALDRPAPPTFVVERLDEEAPAEPVPGRLLSLALSFLAAAEIDVDVLGATIAGGIHEGRNGPIDLVVITREEAEQLLAYARLHEAVPDDRRAEVMELLTRINPQLPGTWFEIELETGRVSCRATLNARGTNVVDDTFAENVIWLALSTMDEHQPAIRGVAYEGISVAAIRAADDELDAEDAGG